MLPSHSVSTFQIIQRHKFRNCENSQNYTKRDKISYAVDSMKPFVPFKNFIFRFQKVLGQTDGHAERFSNFLTEQVILVGIIK